MSKGEAILAAVPGVEDASINLATSTATVIVSGEHTQYVSAVFLQGYLPD